MASDMPLLLTALVYFLLKHHEQKQLGKGKFYFSLLFTSQFIMEGSWDQYRN